MFIQNVANTDYQVFQSCKNVPVLSADAGTEEKHLKGTVLKIEDLSLPYSSRKTTILNKINLQVKHGEFIGIAGAPGSGKTLFLKSLFGLRRDYTGTIRINGRDLPAMPLPQVYYSIGYMPQRIEEYFFLPVIDEELSLAGEGRQIWDKNFYTRVLEDLDIANVNGKTIGQLTLLGKRLVCLASVILRGRHLVLLDECLEQFDDHLLGKVKPLLEEILSQGTSVIMTGSSANFLKRFTSKIYTIANNTLEYCGPTEPLGQIKDFTQQETLLESLDEVS